MAGHPADGKTGPRTVWLGLEAAELLAAVPQTGDTGRAVSEDLTSDRLYTVWCAVRDAAPLSPILIPDPSLGRGGHRAEIAPIDLSPPVARSKNVSSSSGQLPTQEEDETLRSP